MTTNFLRRMAAALGVGLVLLGALSTAQAAAPKPAPVPMGDNTYSLTRSSGFAWALGTGRLKEEAREDAEKFCADMGKKMEVISLTGDKASLLHGGYSKATIVFRAVDAATPAVAAAPAAGNGESEFQMLVDLHDKKLLSDEEFEAGKKRLVEKSQEFEQLLELKQKGILSEAEFEAARSRLMDRAK